MSSGGAGRVNVRRAPLSSEFGKYKTVKARLWTIFQANVFRNFEGVPLQGYLAYKKPPSPLGPPYGPRDRATAGS